RDESSKILLEKRGILSIKDKETSIITKTKICVNCQEPNRPDAQWCISCKMILSYTSYKETLEKQIEKDKKIQMLESKVDSLNKQVENIPVTIGQHLSAIFQKFGLVDYNLIKNKTKNT
ncbi:MAG TPA: hypothetical protein VFV86_06095, partial [Nitrososphaeraceae archaeon]|nr:hypothetical protein [Nitrososphaeraceae archaeon]